VATVASACHILLYLLVESVELCTQNVYWHDCNDHQSNISGFGLKILPTLAITRPQRAGNADAIIMVAALVNGGVS
jgi:hypothetical protein